MLGSLTDPSLEIAVLSWGVFRSAQYAAAAVSPEDFASPAHQAVATALDALRAQGSRPTVQAIAIEVQRLGKLDACGGEHGIATLAAGSGSAPDVEALKEMARLRRVHMASLEAASLAERGDMAGAMDALARAKDAATPATRAATRTAAELAEVVLEGVLDGTRPTRGVHPGIQGLVDTIGQLRLGSLTVIGADSNVGKSQFALEMIMRAADQGVGAGLISMEDPDDITGSRLVAAATGVSSGKLMSRDLRDEDFQALGLGVETLKAYKDKLLFDSCVGGSDLDVCAAMSRQASRGAKIVVVDYIQEIECSKKQQDRRNEIRWLVNRLKSHAISLNVALVAVSQLSRPKDGETARKPTKHHLKESGDTTASAEVIILLWRETEADDAPVKVEIAKCKWGGIGDGFEMKRQRSGRLVQLNDPRGMR